MSCRCEIEVHAVPEAMAQIRRMIRDWDDLPPSAQGDVQVVASELATNAVLHAGLSSRDKIFVTLSQNRDRVLVEVEDRGRGFVREHLADLASPVGYGLGLQIVGALAERWDTQPARGVVWAEVRLAGA